jgi:hypothetical protein
MTRQLHTVHWFASREVHLDVAERPAAAARLELPPAACRRPRAAAAAPTEITAATGRRSSHIIISGMCVA